jgi:hypothetical protein
MQTRTFLFILLVLLAACVATAQEDWNITGAGARAEGLGGAFIGVADDATAISWNPAGLGQLERSEFSVVGRWIGEELKHERTGFASQNYTINQSHFAYNFASIAFPLHAGNINFVPAVAYHNRMDFYTRYSLTLVPDLVIDGDLYDKKDYSYESTGGVNSITPGIAVKLSSLLYVGATANFWLGDFDDTDEASYVQQSGRLLPFIARFENHSSCSGVNYTAGLLLDLEGLKAKIPIRIGATVRTPFDLKVEGDQAVRRRLVSNASVRDSVDFKYTNTVELPLMLGVGISGRITENFSLAFDYEMRRYGSSKIKQRSENTRTGAITEGTSNLSAGEENLNQIRVGAEYLAVTSGGVIPLRVGYRTMPTLRSNWDAEGKADGQVIGYGFTAGTGFISNRFAFDITYARTSWEQKFAKSGSTDSYLSQTISASAIIYF